MSEQTEVQRLIQHMDDEWPEDWDGNAIRAELLRLQALNSELLEALNRQYALNAEMLKALEWIADRCPVHLVDHPLHNIHKEMAHDAGACARAAIAKAGVK